MPTGGPELSKFLPTAMPNGIRLRVGDKVYFRLNRCKHRVFKGSIEGIQDNEGNTVKSIVPSPDEPLIRIDVKKHDTDDTDDTVTYQVQPYRDSIFTLDWINQYAGTSIVEEESAFIKKAKRFQRLLEQ